MSPLISTFSGASARGYGMFGSLGGNYWWGIPYVSGGSTNRSTMGISGDTSGNAYALWQNGSGVACFLQYDAVSKTCAISSAYANPSTRGLGLRNGTRYWGVFDGYVAPAGQVTAGNSLQNYFRYYTPDPSGANLVEVASRAVAAQTYVGRMATDGSASFVYQRVFGASGCMGIGKNISGDTYIMGMTSSVVWIAKYNPGYVLQWQKSISATSPVGATNGPNLGVDNDGNAYISYQVGSTCYITVFDTNGTQVSNVSTAFTNPLLGMQGIPSGGAVLAVSYGNGIGLMRVNTDGTVGKLYLVGIYANNTPTASSTALVDMTVNGENIYIIGNTELSGTGQVFVMNLPTTMAITGTFTTTSTAQPNYLTLASATNPYTWVNATKTAATSSYTDSAAGTTYTSFSLSTTAHSFTWDGKVIS
jgi:hypothetical protein